MASQDPPVMQAPLQTLGIYDTAKECFLSLAKMMEKGISPPVLIDDYDIVMTPMPSGQELQAVRDSIENSLEHLRTRLSQKSKWKVVRTMSADKEDFFMILYCSDAFSSPEEATRYALAKRLKMRQLNYTKAEVEDTAKSVKDTIKRHFLGLAKLDENPNHPAIATDYKFFVGSPLIGGSIKPFYDSFPAKMAKNGHGDWIVAIFPPLPNICFTIAYCADNFASKEEAFEHVKQDKRTEALEYTDDELKEGNE